VLAALGLNWLIEGLRDLGMARYLKPGVAIILVLLTLVIAVPTAYGIASGIGASADSEWQAALHYIRDNTPPEAMIMTSWGYGYWVLDIGRREPVVDNGLHTEEMDRDVALVYCAEDDAQAVEIMNKHGASYVIFSRLEMRFMPWITELGLEERYGDGDKLPWQMQDSLYARALFAEYAGQSFQTAYKTEEIVVLRLIS